MFAMCKCLNILIKTKGIELQNVNIDDIELSASEKADPFFKNDIAIISDLENITKEQSALVEMRSVGRWTIHRCYNCLMYTHAVHREYGAAKVLMNTAIVTREEEIAKLKSSPNYSPIFRILVDQNKVNNIDLFEPPSKFSVTHLSSNLRVALGGLEQQLEEAIQGQARLIEQRIHTFTKEQYQILEEFRERAHNEHSFLARLICNEQQVVNNSANLETPPATPETMQPSKSTSEEDDVDVTSYDSKTNEVWQNSASKSSKIHTVNGDTDDNDDDTKTMEISTFDGEPMFVLEGMDDVPLPIKHLQASDHESDTDDSGNEPLYISKNQRGGHPTMAKSLPVTVPPFPSFGFNRSILDEDDEQVSRDPLDPHNIEASIKALAKSVHGDAVFGDLPRPRFSTKI